MARALLFSGAGGSSDGSVKNRGFIVQDLVNERFRFIDALGNRALIYLLACEASEVDRLVRCDDDALCMCDFFCRQHILRAYGALGLGFQG